MESFILTILTPEGEIFEGKATSVIAPGESGYFEILHGHAHFVSVLVSGAITVKTDGKTIYYGIDDGAAEAINNDIRLMVEHCVEATSLDEAKKHAAELAALDTE